LQDIFSKAKSEIDRNKEPIEELKKAASFFEAICENPTSLWEKDEAYKKFFY